MVDSGALKGGRSGHSEKASDGYRPRASERGVALAIRDSFLRQGLKTIIQEGGRFDVAAAEDLDSCLALARPDQIAVLIVDLGEVTPHEIALLPGIRATGIRVLGLGDADGLPPGHLDVAVSRADGPAGLLKVLTGFASSSRVVREPRATYGSRLTPRERDVAKLIALGLANRDIATRLDLREQSIKNLASIVMRKLHCDNRVQVALQLAHEPSVAAT